MENTLVGGTDTDRKQVYDQFVAYLEANSKFDWETLLAKIWSGAPEATYFNLNGHTYKGRDHWIRLWKYYKQHMETGIWIPYDIGGFVDTGLAVVWCHRKTQLKWVGTDPRPQQRHHDSEFMSRSTMVFHKENDKWRCVHVHFSEGSTDIRPGGI